MEIKMIRKYKRSIWTILLYITAWLIIFYSVMLSIAAISLGSSTEILNLPGTLLATIIFFAGIIISLPFFFMGSMIDMISRINYHSNNIDVYTRQIMKIKEYENDIFDEEKTE